MYRDDFDTKDRNAEDVYSKPVRAGKRTYFFDVKSTRGANDFYMTITESKRRQNPDGTFTYDKHKIFLYKEDFEKFQEGFTDAVEYIRQNCFNGEIPQRPVEQDEKSDIEFEDL